ncbi:MAG TPA: ATP-binding protein [Gemmatimonadaceae bacterium]|nr:ATP-binding protein [Gemmatimonadaceae bacterium]
MITETDLPPTTRVSSLRAIIERLPDGIVIVDTHGNIRFANPAAERLFDRSAEDLFGTSFGFPVVVGETTEIDIVQRGGGGVVFAELRVVETEWEDEHVQLVSLRDITDRKQSEERAHQLVAEREDRLEAEAASRAKSEFLAIMSHELRTPLNAVLGYSELLELGISGPLTDKMREQIGRIRMSGVHLLGLVNDILDLAKVEAGRLQVRSDPASAEGTVAAALALIQPQAAAGGLELTIQPTPRPAPIYRGDEERVRQILVNLLSNAVKFTPTGGTIRLEISQASVPDQETRLQPNRSYVSFRVIDTGAGIPEEKLVSIFDPFVQAESGHTRPREGTGLGLTISRRLARLMGGDLTVKSKVGAGSTFTLWLPADLSAKEIEPTPAIAGQPVTAQVEVEGLGDVGLVLLRSIEKTVERVVDRMLGEPSLNVAAGLKYSLLADHLAALLADIGGALVVMEEAKGSHSATLADTVEIQRLISELHGAQRQRLGWSEAVLRREFMILREELERVVRHASEFGEPLPIEDGVSVIGRFLDQAEYIAVRALNARLGSGMA